MKTTQPEIEHLIIAAEARIESAITQLLLASKGVRDASDSQQIAITELRAARDSIKLLRERLP